MIQDEYKKINIPEELMDFMNKYIKYGFHGTDGVDYTNDGTIEGNKKFQKASQIVYGLASPDYILKYRIGHCWDQVELERDWFTRHNYEFTTNFIWFEIDYENTYTCHTYLVYKDKNTNEYCIFEHSDYFNRGIHRFRTYKEAVKWQYERHIKSNLRQGNNIDAEILKHIHIYEYKQPKYRLSMMEFINHVLEAKDITDIIKGDEKIWNY